MGTSEILQALNNLNPTDQLKIAETALQLIQHNHQTLTPEQRRQQMAIAQFPENLANPSQTTAQA
jgi:hypothetical protein